MKKEIKQIIDGALSELYPGATGNFQVEKPADLSNGDYSSNVAMALAKNLGKSPVDLAKEIVNKILTDKPDFISKIEVAGPGFINFHFAPQVFVDFLNKIQDGGLKLDQTLSNQKIIFEYTNTNVFKTMHIGHLVGNVIGESLVRLYAELGAEVKRCTYQGDVGLHVAKAIWGMIQSRPAFPQDTDSLEDKMNFLNNAYSNGSRAYEDDANAKEEIKVINKKVFEKSDPEIQIYYDKGRVWSLAHFEEMYEKLGTKFDYYFFESEVADDALKIIRANIGKVFEESEGAVIYRGEKKGLHTRVFINSEGLPTYEAKDIAHALRKYAKYPADKSIVLTANEQDNYFKVILSALDEINHDIASHMSHLSHGLLRLTTGKISSRKGNAIDGEDLIDAMEEKITEVMSGREIDPSLKDKTIEQVSLSAVRFSTLRQAIGKDTIFDPEKSISFEGDSGPYVQYTARRAKSVLEKSSGKNFKIKQDEYNLADAAVTLQKKLLHWDECIFKAAEDNSPHHLVTYALSLAGDFNSFYANTKIISDEKESEYYLTLTEATLAVLTKILNLLAIEVPEEM